MRDLVCRHCNATVQAPDDETHCVRCGQVLDSAETHVTATPPPAASQAIQPGAFVEPIAPLAHYASWDEFRATSPSVHQELMKLIGRALPDLRSMKVLRLPVDTPTEIDRWGKPLASLNVPGQNWLISQVGAALLISIGLGSIFLFVVAAFMDGLPELRKDGVGVFLWLVYGVGLIGIGTWIIVTRKRQLPTTLWVFENGLFLNHHGKSHVARWDEVQDYESSNETGSPLYELTFAYDVSVAFSAGTSPFVVPVMEYIEIRMSGSQLLQRLHAIWRGELEPFGVVRLDRHGFHGPNILVPWHEVRRVITDSDQLFVDWTRTAEWVPIRYRDVSHPYLVMAISHIMIDDHDRLGPVDA